MNKKLSILVIIALILKLSLFAYALKVAPDIKFEPDSKDYLQSGITMVTYGVFAKKKIDDRFYFENFRTPGYPLFLGILHGLLDIPINGIVVIQIILSLYTAIITYRAARMINEKLGMLSAIIILFDPSITLYSLRILTETLFLFLMSIFMYQFIKYIKFRKLPALILSSLVLAAATYVRPVAYYLGFVIVAFLVYMFIKEALVKTDSPDSIKSQLLKSSGCILVFSILMYSLVGLWQYRNYSIYKTPFFSRIEEITLHADGIFSTYKRKKDKIDNGHGPVYYFFTASSRGILSLMTRPVSLKYLNNKALTVAGKVFAYPWIVFWLIGFLVGIYRMRGKNEFLFLLLIVLYFLATVLGAALSGAGSRFRVPMMPFIAILSAYGWSWIVTKLPKKRFSN